MNDNLLALMQQALGGDVSRQISEFLGESQDSTESALGLLLPAVLGGIAHKGATPQGAGSLLSLIDGANLDTGAPANLAGLLGGGGAGAQAMLQSSGGNLVADLFGDRGGALAAALASGSGMQGGSANNLLALSVPLVLTLLKKFIGEKGLDARALSSLLVAQAPHLKRSLDSRLSSAMGFADPGALLGASGGKVTAAAGSGAAAAAKAAVNSGQARIMPWVIVAALAFLVWNLLSGQPDETPLPESVATAPAPALEPEPATLSSALPASIYFDVGEATLGADGYSTIEVIARLINREGLQVAVTGYTDLALNEELAKNRALAVVDALRAEGVADAAIQMQPPGFVEAGVSEGMDAEARRVDIALQSPD